jgi:hypothetical protein
LKVALNTITLTLDYYNFVDVFIFQKYTLSPLVTDDELYFF